MRDFWFREGLEYLCDENFPDNVKTLLVYFPFAMGKVDYQEISPPCEGGVREGNCRKIEF